MKNMRRGFTMIELIFIIVIIGVLAAIAIPKLVGTRDDATIIAGVTNVKQAIKDIGSYCIARGEFGTWQEMTAVNLDRKNKQKRTRYQVENQNCIVFIRTDNPDSITVKVNNKGYNKVPMCKSISDELIKQNVAAKKKGIKHMFGGSSIPR